MVAQLFGIQLEWVRFPQVAPNFGRFLMIVTDKYIRELVSDIDDQFMKTSQEAEIEITELLMKLIEDVKKDCADKA